MNNVNEYRLLCPNCGYERYFSNKYTMKKAEKRICCNRCSHGSIFQKVKHLINDEKTKLCPKCGKTQKYKENSTYYRALLKNILCNSCKEFTDDHKKNITKSLIGKIVSKMTVNKRKRTIKERYPDGVKKSKEAIQKTVDGLKKWRLLNPDKERQRILNTRKTLLKNYGEYFTHTHKPSYNKNACKIFDSINKELRWNGIHAETNKDGEYKVKMNDYTQFYVDYYEPNYNVVIEYDERYHFKPCFNKKLEKRRQNKITEFLNCKFYRIKYNDDVKKFIEYLKYEFKPN